MPPSLRWQVPISDASFIKMAPVLGLGPRPWLRGLALPVNLVTGCPSHSVPSAHALPWGGARVWRAGSAGEMSQRKPGAGSASYELTRPRLDRRTGQGTGPGPGRQRAAEAGGVWMRPGSWRGPSGKGTRGGQRCRGCTCQSGRRRGWSWAVGGTIGSGKALEWSLPTQDRGAPSSHHSAHPLRVRREGVSTGQTPLRLQPLWGFPGHQRGKTTQSSPSPGKSVLSPPAPPTHVPGTRPSTPGARKSQLRPLPWESAHRGSVEDH